MQAHKLPRDAGRMALTNLVRGPQKTPFRVLVFGVEGVGKSTFAANAPSPVFLCGEQGVNHLDVVRFPTPRSWLEVFEALAVLLREKHEFKTLVIDTIDWLEPLCWAHVCATAGKSNIEDFGYGKGYVMALDQWRMLLDRLDQIHAKGINVILLAHTQVKKQDDPHTGGFDRYRLKLHDRAADLFREWCDAVLFARHEVFVQDKKGKTKGFSTGARILHTEWNAAFDAKNRFGLPSEIPLSWHDFEEAVRAGQPGHNIAELNELIAQLPEGERTKATKARDEWARGDSAKLAQLLDRVRGKLALATATEVAPEQTAQPEPPVPPSAFDDLRKAISESANIGELQARWAEVGNSSLSSTEKKDLAAIKDTRKKQLLSGNTDAVAYQAEPGANG